MRLQIASDLHHELASEGTTMSRPIPLADNHVDALILAGDIANGTSAIELYANYPVPVLYVCGNHEFYGYDVDSLLLEARRASEGTSVTLLEGDEVIIDDVRFLGVTLWTDYAELGGRMEESMWYAKAHVLDHRKVRNGTAPFEPEEAALRHQDAKLFLIERLSDSFVGPTVVVTHHAPSINSVPARERNNRLLPAFVSNFESLMPGVDLWIHGHVHQSSDYRVGRCRVVCNPRGYPGRNRSNPTHEYENTGYDPMKTIDVIRNVDD